jgi:diketogulonate reductase-like aldo/keto reductase
MASIPTLTMNDGRVIRQLGFGVFQVPPAQTEPAVTTALRAGYRLIDTAQGYGNEEGVGEALGRSGLPRNEFFITTKLTNSEHGTDKALKAFEESLRKLGLDEVDLFLIHWPVPARDLYVQTWQTLEKIHAEGRARSIGVSNFTEAHLSRLAAETEVVPTVNQVELHPRFPQQALRAYHAEHGILTEAWSPIGQGQGLLEDQTIIRLAARKKRSPAQVVLRWHMQLGNIAIPKSVTPERIRENIDIFDFALDGDEMRQLNGLTTGERIGPDPDTFNSL